MSCIIIHSGHPRHEIIDLYYATSTSVNHDRCLTLNAEIPLDLPAWLTFCGCADSGLVSLPPSDAISHDQIEICAKRVDFAKFYVKRLAC